MEYNKETKTLIILYDFNKELKDIPKETEIIIFENKFNEYNLNYKYFLIFPQNLIHLTFNENFSQKLNNFPQYFLCFSKNLTHLTFGRNFNYKVNKFPKNLIEIIFGYWYAQKKNIFPKNLTHLTFGNNYNRAVDNLPKNLTHLILGNYFNQKVDTLPQNLTYLTLDDNFNKKIDNLPKNLTHLTLGNYCRNINKFPKNIKYLKLNWNSRHYIEHMNWATINFLKNFTKQIILPKNILYLALGIGYTLKFNLPKTIKELLLTANNDLINNIPEHIEKIYIYFINQHFYNKRADNLPMSIKEIIIENEKFKDYIKIPFGCILTVKKLNN
jgi:hypothetical protein